jgi:hypothetical protein
VSSAGEKDGAEEALERDMARANTRLPAMARPRDAGDHNDSLRS